MFVYRFPRSLYKWDLLGLSSRTSPLLTRTTKISWSQDMVWVRRPNLFQGSPFPLILKDKKQHYHYNLRLLRGGLGALTSGAIATQLNLPPLHYLNDYGAAISYSFFEGSLWVVSAVFGVGPILAITLKLWLHGGQGPRVREGKFIHLSPEERWKVYFEMSWDGFSEEEKKNFHTKSFFLTKEWEKLTKNGKCVEQVAFLGKPKGGDQDDQNHWIPITKLY